MSEQQTRPGATITDRVVVTGLGALSATVQVDLWGPFRRARGDPCAGTPLLDGNVRRGR